MGEKTHSEPAAGGDAPPQARSAARGETGQRVGLQQTYAAPALFQPAALLEFMQLTRNDLARGPQFGGDVVMGCLHHPVVIRDLDQTLGSDAGGGRILR